jgi:pimeloyl-ACP methyl ester carboxylesterase
MARFQREKINSPLRAARQHLPASALAFLMAGLGCPAPMARVDAQVPVAPAATATPAAAHDLVAGRWFGRMNGLDLPTDVCLDLALADAGWTGTAYVPLWGEARWPLEDLVVDGRRVTFSIRRPGTAYAFAGACADGLLDGPFAGSDGATGVFAVSRRDPLRPAGPRRPQTPVPPFPHREVPAAFASGGTRLAGTLTLPRGAGRHPAVLLIPGSSPFDRRYAAGGHEFFTVLADRLARAGVASLRVDDRGTGDSAGDKWDARLADLVGDGVEALGWLRAHSDVDPHRVGLVGHSAGAEIAAMVAAARGDDGVPVALLGAPGVAGDKLGLIQEAYRGRALGRPPAVTRQWVDFKAYLNGLAVGTTSAAEVVAGGLAYAGPIPAVGGKPPDEAWMRAYVSLYARTKTRDYLRTDPSIYYSRLTGPVLLMYGGSDLETPPDENAPAIRAAVRNRAQGQFREVVLAGHNHSLQHCLTGLPGEVAACEETISEDALDQITSWVRQTLRPARQ